MLEIDIDAYSYVNPFVIIGSLGLLIHFSNLQIRHNIIINWIAKSSFGVYLIHTNPNIVEPIFKTLMIKLFETYNGIPYLTFTLVTLMGIFALGIIFDQPRKWLWNLILSRFV